MPSGFLKSLNGNAGSLTLLDTLASPFQIKIQFVAVAGKPARPASNRAKYVYEKIRRFFTETVLYDILVDCFRIWDLLAEVVVAAVVHRPSSD